MTLGPRDHVVGGTAERTADPELEQLAILDQALIDRGRGRIVGVSRWTSRADLEASGETARALLASVAELGGTLAGEPQILEEAFDAAASV